MKNFTAKIRQLLAALPADYQSRRLRKQSSRASTTGTALFYEPLEPRLPLAAAGLVDVGTQPEGALSGKIVYTHGGHGIVANTSGNWGFQRPLLYSMIEDLGNQDQMTFFADYLFRAGATVVPLRPVGTQPNEVVLDNDDVDVTFSGAWSNSSNSVYFGSPGDVPYRFASTSATETAVATYRPNIPEDGFYPIYSWTLAGSDRAADQLYRVNHSGGSTEVTINHRQVGSGPIYLGTYYFEAGNEGSVEISNRSSEAGRVVIADMIRFGNGMGDINKGAGVSGLPREDEAGLYWVQWHVDRSQGISDSEYRATSDDRSAAVSFSPRYSEFMNREADGSLSDRVFVSFHSNAGGGGSRGVLGLHNGNNNPSTATPNQELLAERLAREVNDDMVAQNGQYEHNWSPRGDVTLDRSDIEFGEINNLRINNEFDATIVETAFHDNLLDAELMRDPKVRDAIARATYQGLVRYFNNVDNGATSVIMAPGKVDGVRAETAGADSVTVSWELPASNDYAGDAPTGYMIYGSTNGYGFDGGTFVAGGSSTSHTFTGLDPAEGAYHFKVVAVNDGGQSPDSEVVSAIPGSGSENILIVNGFDRLGRTQNPIQQVGPGPTERVRPRLSNSYDYSVQVASAIANANTGVTVDTTSNEALIAGDVQLGDYDAVVWILGEESSADSTFDSTEQTLVTNYLAAGGKLFASGSEVAWDLDFLNNGRSFYKDQLQGDYVADDAGTYTVSGAAGSIFDGLNFTFDNGSRFYNVDFPDVISPTSGEQTLDNGDGASVYSETGTWSTATGTGYNGTSYRFAAAGGDPATASWDFFVSNAGQGEVFVQYRSGVNRATSTFYQVETGNGTETVTIDQTQNNLEWVSLGTFDFTDGSHQVVLDAQASTGGSVVIADAVRIVMADTADGNSDFNNSGLVDGSDFLAWQRGVATSQPTKADGDANGDGAVDSDDLSTWETQFGTSPPEKLTALNYVGGTGGGAGIQYDSGSSMKVVNFGFPFETIADAAQRDAVMSRVLEFFGFESQATAALQNDGGTGSTQPLLSDSLPENSGNVALAGTSDFWIGALETEALTTPSAKQLAPLDDAEGDQWRAGSSVVDSVYSGLGSEGSSTESRPSRTRSTVDDLELGDEMETSVNEALDAAVEAIFE